MQTFDDDIFEGGHDKVRQTRNQKHQQWRAHVEEIAQEEMLDTDQSHVIALHPLDISAGELKVLQAADTTLDAVKKRKKTRIQVLLELVTSGRMVYYSGNGYHEDEMNRICPMHS